MKSSIDDHVIGLTMRVMGFVCIQEEKSELAKEIETLQARLKHLEAQQSSSTRPLASSKSENALLRESVRCQQLSLATSQCVVSGLLVRPPPIYCSPYSS